MTYFRGQIYLKSIVNAIKISIVKLLEIDVHLNVFFRYQFGLQT